MTTPPAKVGGFLRSLRLQQQLLRQRVTRSPTLTPDGSVQADLLSLSAFQILRAGLPCTALKFEVIKGRGSKSGPEAITLLTPLYLTVGLAQKGEKRHSPPS